MKKAHLASKFRGAIFITQVLQWGIEHTQKRLVGAQAVLTSHGITLCAVGAILPGVW